MKITNGNKGFSLFELLVVITIFALLGILVTQSLTMSIRGAKKSEATGKVRDSLSNVLSNMERNIRNSSKLVSTDCSTTNSIEYINENNIDTIYACDLTNKNINLNINATSTPQIGSDVILTSCTISCNSDTVNISITGQSANGGGPEMSEVSMQSTIQLRNY